MASFFNLILDTLAPSGLTLKLNSGATYATSNTVTATITLTDETKTGYGTAGGYKKATAINVTIKGADLATASSGDGTKIIKVFVKNAAGTWSVA